LRSQIIFFTKKTNLMKNAHSLIGLLLFAAAFAPSCKKNDTPSPKNQPLTNTSFEKDDAGWTISGDAQGGYVAASYSPDGGVTDGYIYAADDVTGGVWYYKAPANYMGDKSAYYGATLQFSLFQQSAMADQFDAADIIFQNGDKQITCQLPKYPGHTWTAYSIKIDEKAAWLNGDYDSGDAAGKADIKAVLSHVTGFFIRGEFETGDDTGGMDNVKIIK
jgi:hypothetical protein